MITMRGNYSMYYTVRTLPAGLNPLPPPVRRLGLLASSSFRLGPRTHHHHTTHHANPRRLPPTRPCRLHKRAVRLVLSASRTLVLSHSTFVPFFSAPQASILLSIVPYCSPRRSFPLARINTPSCTLTVTTSRPPREHHKPHPPPLHPPPTSLASTPILAHPSAQ